MSSGSAEIDQTSDSDESCASNLDTNRVTSVGSMGCIVEIVYCRDEFAIPIQLKYGMEAWQQPADCIMGKWSCDQSLKRWFSGNQSLAGISLTEHEQLGISLPDSESQGTSNQLSSLDLWSFGEIMDCHLGDYQQNMCCKEIDLESLETL
jgi:hypothetical protein